METSQLTSPPPELPELPAGVERGPAWPWWFTMAAFATAFFATGILAGLAAAVAAAAGADVKSDSPTVVILGTLAQAVVFVGTAILFARLVARPRPSHFGLRRTAFWPGLGWAALGILTFYIVSAAYQPLVPAGVEQEVTEDLGADEGTFGLIAAGVMVMVVAPVWEEFFFRGFFYRALRSRLSIAVAAIADGILFGLIHYDVEAGAEALLLLPPLALLGVIFCLVYEKTGSLFPVIGMHAFNNSVAYAATAEGGWQVSLVVGPLVLAGCMLAPRFFRPAVRPAPA